MAKKVQLMTNPKQWQVIDGVEVLVDVAQEDIDPVVDSSCVEIEGHRTLEETISQDNMFTPEIVETKVHSKVGGVYHDNVVDGAYEEAILYGNTQVNLVESVTTDTKYIPHSFTSFQGNESKIGNYYSGRTNQVAPLVKGVTMVNLAQTTSSSITSGNGLPIHNVKGSTLYTLSFKFTTKNTNSGVVIQSYDASGKYLENTMQRTGLGDVVKFTFTTHANATKIHICNNTAYGEETIQLDNIMLIEGDVTDLDLPFFKGMRSVELSRPLTNLFTDDLDYRVTTNVVVTNSGGTITTTAQSITTWSCSAFYLNVKPNTEYLVMWDSLSYTHTDTTTQSTICVYGDSKNIAVINNTIKCSTLRSLTFNSAEYKTIELRFHATASNSETGVTTVKGLRVFEWDDSLRTLDLQTIGYFSGTKYVSVRALETEGKNLYPHGDINFTPTDDKVDNWYDAKGTMYMYGDVAQKSKSRFLLKKGTYTIRFGTWSNIDAFQLIDDKETLHGKIQSMATPATFTLEQDAYCTLRLKATSKNVATTVTGIQIERGETATTYEGYSSRYYKPRETEEIILRSLPNGVCDTFNLQTGELAQNIGEVVFNGSDVYGKDGTIFKPVLADNTRTSTTCVSFTHNSIKKRASNNDIGHLKCDKLKVTSVVNTYTNEIEGVSQGGNGQYIQICLNNDKLSSYDLVGVQAYLKSNPITVQYELAEPIITKLQTYARVYSGQTNGLTNMGNNLSALTYYSNNYYVKAGNLSPVPGIIEPITSIPYDVRLKPSTLYTVKYNRGGNSNSMKFDLGGSIVEKTNSITDLTGIAEELTVRTPAILSHEQLILSGTGFAHNFIVVEGDITGTELPYFEGMKDVKMPIIKNIGKNLWDSEFIYGTMGSNNGEFSNVTTAIVAKDITKVRPGKSFIMYNTSNYSMAIVAYDSNKQFLRTISSIFSGTKFTPGTDVYYIRPRTPNTGDPSNCYNDINTKIYLYEYEEGMDTTPQDHKENSVYAVQGEIPITSEMIEQGGFSMSGSSDGSYENSKYAYTARLRSKDLIPVKPNTTYAFAHSFSKFAYNVYQWNGNKKFIDGVSQYFNSGQIETITTTADTQYIHFLMSKHDASEAITVAEYDWSQFHMYELDSTINLRSLPNGVKDELNLLTGEYIQRVGEVVLDGSDDEDWQLYNESIGGSKYFRIGMSVMKLHGDVYTLCTHAICDKLENVVYFSGIYNMSSRPDSVVAFVHSSTLNAQAMFVYQAGNQGDLAQFKQWLNSNPLTVQYELAEPIISHVCLVSNNQEREVGVKLPNGVCNTYNPSTGMTTVRVGTMVLDGSENWKKDELQFYTLKNECASSVKAVNSGEVVIPNTQNFNILTGSYYQFLIVHDKLPSSDITTVNQWKEYLSQNPTQVWYELQYPQIQPDIVLPNGVHDEYNPETGVYTKRVGFIEFDGSEDWTAGNSSGELQQAVNGAVDMYGAWTTQPLPNVRPASDAEYKIPGVCDTFSFKNAPLDETNEEFYFISTSGRFNMNIARTKLTGSKVSHLKAYLPQNPIKLWYELATPITYQLTPYFGLPQPYAYENGYLIHDSAYPKTTLPPEFKYKLVANRTGQVMQNNRKLQEHTTRLSNLEALIIEATIQSLFDRELQLFELELMDIQLIDLGE